LISRQVFNVPWHWNSIFLIKLPLEEKENKNNTHWKKKEEKK